MWVEISRLRMVKTAIYYAYLHYCVQIYLLTLYFLGDFTDKKQKFSERCQEFSRMGWEWEWDLILSSNSGHKGKLLFSEKNTRFVTALNAIKYLLQIK